MKKVDLNFCISDGLDLISSKEPFIPKGKFTVNIDYPIRDEGYQFVVNGPMTVYQLIIRICKHYKKIYENVEKYGVWGHGIEDLRLEGITINTKKNIITLDVGS